MCLKPFYAVQNEIFARQGEIAQEMFFLSGKGQVEGTMKRTEKVRDGDQDAKTTSVTTAPKAAATVKKKTKSTLSCEERLENVVAIFGRGDHFGEIEIFLRIPRVISLRACRMCDLYSMTRWVKVERMEQDFSFSLSFARPPLRPLLHLSLCLVSTPFHVHHSPLPLHPPFPPSPPPLRPRQG